jgi:CRISPR-associated endoribonuclease Cas6
MRIKINFNPTNTEIPAKEIINLTKSYLHKIIGNNNIYHNKFSDYAITPLMRGKYNKLNKSFSFPNGTYIVFSTLNNNLLNIILNNIEYVNFNNILEFSNIEIIIENFTDGNNYVTTLSPILLRDHKIKTLKKNEITFKDKEHFEKILTEKTIIKLSKFDNNLNLTNFNIKLTNDQSYNKINIIPVNKIPNTASQCNLVINTNKKVMNVLYNLGLGMSTGCGFGTIYNTNNYQKYNLNNA